MCSVSVEVQIATFLAYLLMKCILRSVAVVLKFGYPQESTVDLEMQILGFPMFPPTPI